MGETPSDRKTQGKPPTTSSPGDVPTPSDPGTSLPPYRLRTLERAPIPLGNSVHAYQPGDEVRVEYWGKGPRQPVGTGPHMVVWATLLLLKLQASSLGSTTAESRRQQHPLMGTAGKQFRTPEIPSRSCSKNKVLTHQRR